VAVIGGFNENVFEFKKTAEVTVMRNSDVGPATAWRSTTCEGKV